MQKISGSMKHFPVEPGESFPYSSDCGREKIITLTIGNHFNATTQITKAEGEKSRHRMQVINCTLHERVLINGSARGVKISWMHLPIKLE